jgi:hypothetical protein
MLGRLLNCSYSLPFISHFALLWVAGTKGRKPGPRHGASWLCPPFGRIYDSYATGMRLEFVRDRL